MRGPHPLADFVHERDTGLPVRRGKRGLEEEDGLATPTRRNERGVRGERIAEGGAKRREPRELVLQHIERRHDAGRRIVARDESDLPPVGIEFAILQRELPLAHLLVSSVFQAHRQFGILVAVHGNVDNRLLLFDGDADLLAGVRKPATHSHE